MGKNISIDVNYKISPVKEGFITPRKFHVLVENLMTKAVKQIHY